jgi:hypothetical protein
VIGGEQHVELVLGLDILATGVEYDYHDRL